MATLLDESWLRGINCAAISTSSRLSALGQNDFGRLVLPGPQVEQLVRLILRELPRVPNLDDATEAVRTGLDVLDPGLAANLSAELQEARKLVEQQFDRIEILHRHSVLRRRAQWYFGPRPTDQHWPAVRDYLLSTKEWPEDDVRSIDEASNEVVSLLENPDQDRFSCRGLVVGYVQSGKTANMTAVIAKALDAGYDTVIVLAGLTNKLRYQTQLRLFEDLVSRNPMNWQLLTPNDLNRDFRAPAHGGFLAHTDKAQLAVIKKNVSPLGELESAISETIPAVLRRLRILVIDDECDQASVNSARGELDMNCHQSAHTQAPIAPACSYLHRLYGNSLRKRADQSISVRPSETR